MDGDMNETQPGPCAVCGLRDYPLSFAGPTTCADCGQRAYADLLRRIRQWDMLDSCADGSYWKREIDAALAKNAGDSK